MNLILENTNQVEHFTDLNNVFVGLGNRQTDYNWLITHFECNHYPVEALKANAVLLSGEALTEIIENHRIQFIWGTISGFPKSLPIEAIDRSILPLADGNENLWTGDAEVQHPQAHIEIICWDSSCTLLITKDDTLSALYQQYYSDAISLKARNLSITAQTF
jgi:hypothetical protein